MGDEEPAWWLEYFEVRSSAVQGEHLSSMVDASSRGIVEIHISCGGIAGCAFAYVVAKVQDVVWVKSSLFNQGSHERLISPAWWNRQEESVALLHLDGRHDQWVAKQGEASVAFRGSFRLGQKALQELRRVEADTVGRP